MSSLELCKENPRYLEFAGKPILLITSGSHYGPVINLDFDWMTYLDTIAGYGFNHSRVFTGTYIETRDDTFFNVKENNMAPAPGRFIAPWARSSTAGFCEGGNKFDLSKWDPEYFKRFSDFLTQAGKRGVIVEVVLFCYYYCDDMWEASPLHPGSNVNHTPEVPREKFFSMESPQLLAVQEQLVGKMVKELNGFDNLYYELINEPYVGGEDYEEWHDHMTELIIETEADLPKKHLIARNFRHYTQIIERVHPGISIVNFHYAEPSAVMQNYGLGRVVADDETGFKGQELFAYRREAWKFILAGGGVFSHLDYSFTVRHPDGTMVLDEKTPGMGCPEWRVQLAALKSFMERFEFPKMKPANELCGFRSASRGQIFAQKGREYLVYLDEPVASETYGVMLPSGHFTFEWIDPATTTVISADSFDHLKGEMDFGIPAFKEDILLHIARSLV